MFTVNLYKIGALLAGAVVCTIIDTALGVEYPDPWWKQLAHKVVYMGWGAIIIAL